MDSEPTLGTGTELGSMSAVLGIVGKHANERGGLIAILEEIQAKYSYLPEAALRVVAETTGHSLVDIYGAATFYKSFSLQPRGRHLISVCRGTACHVRAASGIAEEVEQKLGVLSGQTTPDKEFTFETVACLGACALGPIVVVDGHYFANVQKAEVKGILARAREGLDKIELKTDDRVFPVKVRCARCNHSMLDPRVPLDGYPSIRMTVSFARKHGGVRLSCLYGSYTTESEHEVPDGTVANFFCPHCHGELSSAADCTRCSAPMVSMLVEGGGILQICSRRGCREHRLDVSGVNL